MAIYLGGKSWYVDFYNEGKRYTEGKNERIPIFPLSERRYQSSKNQARNYDGNNTVAHWLLL
jgi:hypothetical protein